MRTITRISIPGPGGLIELVLPLDAKFLAARTTQDAVDFYFHIDVDAPIVERHFACYVAGAETGELWEFLTMVRSPVDSRELFFGELHRTRPADS